MLLKDSMLLRMGSESTPPPQGKISNRTWFCSVVLDSKGWTKIPVHMGQTVITTAIT